MLHQKEVIPRKVQWEHDR